MSSNNSSGQKLLLIAAVVIIALLALNAFLLYNKYTQDQVIETQQADLDEAGKLKIELEKQYQQALSDLDDMKGNNDELNTVIERQKQELRQQRDRIDRMIESGAELNKARAEIRNLKTLVGNYLAQIQQLQDEKAALAAERDQFAQQSQELSENLDSTAMANEQLTAEKSALITDKQLLASEKSRLLETVNLASVIQVNNISVTPLKERDSGKTVKKKYAKNVDQIRVCFQTTVNEVAKSGKEIFFIRIINPVGETMAIDELGAGKFMEKKSGEETRYTIGLEHAYNFDERDVCITWNPNLGAFQKGKYTVEVYNKGHLAGTGKFDLK